MPKWFTVPNIILSVVVILMLIFGFIFRQRIPQPVNENINTPEKHSQKSEFIYVDIKGEVRVPGVYKLSNASRLYQLIEQAGGLTQYANPTAYNLAEQLKDGQVVIIPRYDEETHNDEDSSLISISNAPLDLLTTLPNIGPATAQAIIDYRNTHGDFTTIEEIMNVRGIGLATFDAIKPFIRP